MWERLMEIARVESRPRSLARLFQIGLAVAQPHRAHVSRPMKAWRCLGYRARGFPIQHGLWQLDGGSSRVGDMTARRVASALGLWLLVAPALDGAQAGGESIEARIERLRREPSCGGTGHAPPSARPCGLYALDCGRGAIYGNRPAIAG